MTTHDEIIAVAREVGLLPSRYIVKGGYSDDIVRFFHAAYAAGAAAENEACARCCDESVLEHAGRADLTASQLAEAIRARRKA